MPSVLQPFLLALVLLDLGFVQLTDSVSPQWLAPLWLSTLVSPWLRRLRGARGYALAWNLTILGAFAWLLQTALTEGVLHMLEGGMLLSALCQVHLLNNVGQRQRPDLLFFNSLLIAFITSFFSRDLGWSLVFAAHAAVLLPALQIFVTVPGDTSPTAGLLRAVLRDAWPRTLGVMAVTALLFAFWPRDFQRPGLLGDALALHDGGNEAGCPDEIRLDRPGPPLHGDQVVMRISTPAGDLLPTPTHWRGMTFVDFDGSSWQPYRVHDFASRRATDPQWLGGQGGRWQRAGQRPGSPLTVRLVDRRDSRLFLPLEATEVRFLGPLDQMLVDPKGDGVIGWLDAGGGGPLSYTVRVGEVEPIARSAGSDLARRRFTAMAPGLLPRELAALAQRLRAELPGDASDAAIASHTCAYVREHRDYALPGGAGFARSLDDFLLGNGAGHCEYFATMLALLLRAQRIPCRLVGGYLAAEHDPRSGEVIVRRRDAHAWVEVLLPDDRWATFDATPPATEAGRQDPSVTWWSSLHEGLERAWRAVTTFDEHGRQALFEALCAMPAAVLGSWSRHPLAWSATIAFAIVLVWLRRSRATGNPAARSLARAVRRSGIRWQPGETPRELLLRAERAGVAAGPMATLRRAIAAHEASRYRRVRDAYASAD